eukprot:CAMPEP_0114277982 /NCGR_PEP_ID=MMETSP0059-20121206/1090_1 /TAXON_ID=36894 /ORGANISM="Pyramimonas parkeae, Strain CCMP726" /LENGTH=112 /DNA_ID=CAMNT_0001398143 /DNA_START=647 /DNA_END=985 /DNA_ORIENTATION=+
MAEVQGAQPLKATEMLNARVRHVPAVTQIQLGNRVPGQSAGQCFHAFVREPADVAQAQNLEIRQVCQGPDAVVANFFAKGQVQFAESRNVGQRMHSFVGHVLAQREVQDGKV